MSGFRKIFRFTLKQLLAIKTVKVLTVTVALLLFLVPSVTMTVIELTRDEKEQEPEERYEEYNAEGVSAVFYAADTEDGLSWESLEAVHLPEYEAVPFTKCASLQEAAELAKKNDSSLILLIEEKEETYLATGIVPEGSGLSAEKADYLAGSFAASRQTLQLLESGLGEEQLAVALRPVNVHFLGEDVPGEDRPGEDVPGEDGPEEESELALRSREILSMALPYLNIMVIYFLVLYYGQSVANSVILEKNSKLMDTFLVAVKPKAMIFGKVLAAWAAALIQFLSWVLALAAGFGLGTFLVKQINPQSPMLLLQVFALLKDMTKILSLPEILLAVILVFAGFFVYCSMAGIAGSFASKPEELSSTISYFTLTLVISMFITLNVGFVNRTLEAGARWYDFVPFTATLITPSRVLLGYVSLEWGLLSLLAMLLLSALFVRLAGKAYSMMSLYKGNVPKLPQILRMLKE